MIERSPERNNNNVQLTALYFGMSITENLDPEIARGMTIDLFKRNPNIIESLPKNVANLLINTRTGEITIPREELQETDYEVPENPEYWTCKQVIEYHTNQE